MSEINKNISIPKNVNSADDLDFGFLRKKGLEYIEKLSHKIWTDYNTHDPGITILDMLSYAITDLGMRISMPIENILAPGTNELPINEQFFVAEEILPSNPVTETDYRKLFIDIPGIKNCWLKPYKKTVYVDCKNARLSYHPDDFATFDQSKKSTFNLQGLYSVLLDFESFSEKEFPTETKVEKEKSRLKELVETTYHANRNLCEDLVEVKEVDTHPVAVCASIEIEPDADEEWVHAKILQTIDNYFSPPLCFYSLQQMFEKGYASDEIFEGPVLQSGFLDTQELKNTELRREVRLSDIINLIMEIQGVKIIKEISITDCNNPENQTDEWIICINEGNKPKRCNLSAFSYFKGVLPVNVNVVKVKNYLAGFNAEEKFAQKNASLNKKPDIPGGIFLQTGETTTIQNDFPEVYGIGPVGLSSQASQKRIAQAKQLKAYLLFFDQIFASYFAQLNRVKDLLSVKNTNSNTYFTQVVKDIEGLEELLTDVELTDENLTEKLFAELDEPVSRKNKILDHLISRFAEKFGEYSFLMKQLYGNYAEKAVLLTKESFLADYQNTSKNRGSAFNYFKQNKKNLWNTNNVSGVVKRVARLCGMKNYKRRNLSESFLEMNDLINSGGEKVYRWHIKNEEGNYILSSTTEYTNLQLAEEELQLAILKIIESSPEKIKKAFKNSVPDEIETENFEIQLSESGKYSFDVINPDVSPSSTHRIVASQYLYNQTKEELLGAILYVINFVTHVFTEEGMLLLEHILLRPDVTKNSIPLEQFMPICKTDCEGCAPVDPYSFRVTIVLPGWTYRFGNPDFRNYMEELIRKELPAHVLARICWPGYRKNNQPASENDMVDFENAYKAFLYHKTNAGQKQDEIILNNLNNILPNLNSIYPAGKLIDCDDESDSVSGKIILGRTNIGNL